VACRPGILPGWTVRATKRRRRPEGSIRRWAEAIDNLAPDSIETIEQARAAIARTRDLVSAIAVDDAKLDEIKRVGLGPGRYCELTGHRYVADWLMPNLYFHITIACAILRMLGAPVGKTDFLRFLAPEVKLEG
jgi:uncharacterized protein